jgi:dTMP kinase
MFISLEGCAGSGKTTQATLLYKNLIKKGGREVILTKFSGETELGDKIQKLVESEEIEGATLDDILLLHLTSILHVNKTVIWPNLKKGNVVICDRHIDYVLAFHRIWLNKDSLKIEKMYELLSRELTPEIPESSLYPDFTFILDLDIQEIRKRNKNDGRYKMNKGRENLYIQSIIREHYLELAKKKEEFWGERFICVNASNKIPKISKKITSASRYIIDNNVDPVINTSIHRKLFTNNKKGNFELKKLVD